MATLKDIASQAGVSVATVSKALNQSPEISPETIERVKAVADSLGYVAKRQSGRTETTIGVILPEVQSQYYATLLQVLNRRIEKRGCAMVAMLTSGYASELGPVLRRMKTYSPDGLIVFCGSFSKDEEMQLIYKSGIPTIILTEVETRNCPIDCICISVEQGVRLAVEHLLEQGHTKIGYLGEYSSDIRYEAFCKVMEENGHPVDPRFVKRTEKRFEEGGYDAARKLLEETELPTAVFASYDQIAFGAMRAFFENKVKVPKDISIVGFDDVVMSEYCQVPLTSVTNPVKQMGVTALSILMDAIQKRSTHVVQNVELQSRLIVRASTLNQC